MRHSLAIAQREIAEKSFVFLAALALAVVACVMPFAPGVHQRATEVITVAATICAISIAFGMSLMLGATIVGREVTERRLSFYFTKPISAASIWAGKVIASAVLIVGGFAIAALPALFAGRAEFQRMFGDRLGLVVPFEIIVTAAFFIAHVVSSVVRSRSPWVVADFLALIILALVAWIVVQPLLNHGALGMLVFVGKVFGWLALAAVAAAGAWQMEKGRTDRQQSHRALTLFLWPAAATAVLICGAMVWWVVSATPSDLTGVHEIGVGSASEVIIVGPAVHRRDYLAVFLVDMNNGNYERLSGVPIQGGFAGNGRKLVLFQPVGRASRLGEVIIRDSGLHGAETHTGLVIEMSPYTIALSADGKRIAYVSHDVLSVYDVPSKTSLGSVRVSDVRTMWFLTPDLLRVYSATHGTREVATKNLDIFEYDLQARHFAQTGYYQTAAQYLWFLASTDGSRLFLRGDAVTQGPGSGSTLSVLDGRTGAVRMSLRGDYARSLPDGRLITTESRRINVYDQHGALLRIIPVDAGRFRFGVSIVSPSRILVEIRKGDTTPAWSSRLIDIDTGSVVAQADDLQPVESQWWFADARSASIARPDRLFRDGQHNLVHWNLVTNRRNVLVKMRS